MPIQINNQDVLKANATFQATTEFINYSKKRNKKKPIEKSKHQQQVISTALLKWAFELRMINLCENSTLNLTIENEEFIKGIDDLYKFLQQEIKADYELKSLRRWVAKYGSIELANYLLEKNFKFQSQYIIHELNPLHIASKYNRSEMFDFLLANSSLSINSITGTEGYTPLHIAAKHGSPAITKHIISNKMTNKKAKCNNNMWAYHVAAKFNPDPNVLQVLIDEQTYIDVKDQFKQTPLHLAAQYNKPEVVQKLINARANLNQKDKTGETPLHKAIQNNKYENVRLLIQAKADVNIENDNNISPKQMIIDNLALQDYLYHEFEKDYRANLEKIKCLNNEFKLPIGILTKINCHKSEISLESMVQKSIKNCSNIDINPLVTFKNQLESIGIEASKIDNQIKLLKNEISQQLQHGMQETRSQTISVATNIIENGQQTWEELGISHSSLAESEPFGF